MSEKRFIRNIVGDIYDSEKDKWFEEDWEGKPLDYEDDLIVFLNEQEATIEHLKERLYDFEKRKIIDESEIDEDVIPKIKLLRTELFGE